MSPSLVSGYKWNYLAIWTVGIWRKAIALIVECSFKSGLLLPNSFKDIDSFTLNLDNDI